MPTLPPDTKWDYQNSRFKSTWFCKRYETQQTFTNSKSTAETSRKKCEICFKLTITTPDQNNVIVCWKIRSWPISSPPLQSMSYRKKELDPNFFSYHFAMPRKYHKTSTYYTFWKLWFSVLGAIERWDLHNIFCGIAKSSQNDQNLKPSASLFALAWFW